MEYDDHGMETRLLTGEPLEITVDPLAQNSRVKIGDHEIRATRISIDVVPADTYTRITIEHAHRGEPFVIKGTLIPTE